jgi:hypothetical protein
MPALQTLFTQLNASFGPDSIRVLDIDMFDQERTLASMVSEEYQAVAADALDAIPSSIHDAIRAVLRSAVSRQMPVTLAWAPGYDFRLSVWDVADTDQTQGGITVFLETRYPSDGHPITGTFSAAADAARARGER